VNVALVIAQLPLPSIAVSMLQSLQINSYEGSWLVFCVLCIFVNPCLSPTMDLMRLVPGREQSTGDKIEEQIDNCCPSLTWTQRMIGFGVTAGVISLLMILSIPLSFCQVLVSSLRS
jgi:hypothetical protein